MTLEAVNLLAADPSLEDTDEPIELIPQPGRLNLPIRVPVQADCGGVFMRAEVIASTGTVLLVQGPPGGGLPPVGTPMRLRLEWDRQLLNGRLAAHGVAGRFLVSIGERAIRGARRFPVKLPGLVRSAHLPGVLPVQVQDLSTGGARVEGIRLPIGSEVDLRFTPPGRSAAINVLGFVVRDITHADVPAVGVAFRLVQPCLEILGGTSLAPK